MSYATGRADFASGAPDGAWWLYARDDGRTNACSTNGTALVLSVRSVLGLAPLTAWDSSLLGALRTHAADLAGQNAAWAPVSEQLARSGDTVTRLAVLFAIYLAYYAPSGMRFDAIALPDAADLPRLGALVDGDPQPVVCWDPSRDPDPSRADADREGAARETRFGVRIHPGEPDPMRGPAHGSPYSGPGDTAALLGIGLAVLLAVWLFSEK